MFTALFSALITTPLKIDRMAELDNKAPADKQSDVQEKGTDKALDNVDRLDLLKDFNKMPGKEAAPAPPPGGDGGSKSEQLVFDNIFNSVNQSAPFTEIGRSKTFDDKKPTAAFIDDFAGGVGGDFGKELLHGQVSMAAAEKAGFNTIGLQMKNSGEATEADFSRQINGVADKIKDGTFPLGKGDVLNISMGNLDPTFDQASKFLGFPVTAENLAGQKENILKRMGEIAKDDSRTPEDRETAARVLRTNEAIDRVQASGVEVIHSAGNDGPDRFSWDFMNAKTQLSSNKPTGKADGSSASHSLTTKGDGILPVKFNNEANLLDPTPIKNQIGNLEIGDTGVKFPSTNAHRSNNMIFDREAIETKRSQPRVLPQARELRSEDFDGKLTASIDQIDGKSTADKIVPANQFSGHVFSGKNFTRLPIVTEESKRYLSEPKAGQSVVAGFIEGTSFSNIGYLKANRERLEMEKAGR